MSEKTKLDLAIDKIKNIYDAQAKRIEISKTARTASSIKDLKKLLSTYEDNIKSKSKEVDWVCFAPISFWKNSSIPIKYLFTLEKEIWKKLLVEEWIEWFFDSNEADIEVFEDPKDTLKSTTILMKMIFQIFHDKNIHHAVIRKTFEDHKGTTTTLLSQINDRLEKLVPWYDANQYWIISEKNQILFHNKMHRNFPNTIKLEAFDSSSKRQGTYTTHGFIAIINADEVERPPKLEPHLFMRNLNKLIRNLRKGFDDSIKSNYKKTILYSYNNLGDEEHPVREKYVKRRITYDDSKLIVPESYLKEIDNCKTKKEYLEILNLIKKSTKVTFFDEQFYKLGAQKIRVSIRSMFVNTFLDLQTIKENVALRFTDIDWFNASVIGITTAYVGEAYGMMVKEIPEIGFNDIQKIKELVDPTFQKYEGIIGGGDWGQSALHDTVFSFSAYWFNEKGNLFIHRLEEIYIYGQERIREPEKLRMISNFYLEIFKKYRNSLFASSKMERDNLIVYVDFKNKTAWQILDEEIPKKIASYIATKPGMFHEDLKIQEENYSIIRMDDSEKPSEESRYWFLRDLISQKRLVISDCKNNNEENIHDQFIKELLSTKMGNNGLPLKEIDHRRDEFAYSFEEFIN